MNNVEIVPYKINIYQRGDFFKAHRDSPAKNLIATIVVRIEGEKGVFKVDSSEWEENYTEDLDFCIFFTDVLHEVTPVNKYRETLTFTVFKKESPLETRENLSKEAQQFAQRIDLGKPFGVLLQNGYTYLDITDQQVPFKGLDEKLVVALRELGVKFKLFPVIVKDELRFNEPELFKWRSSEIRTHDEYNGMSDEISNLYIYNLSQKLVELLEMKETPLIGCRDVYYLGMGYKVGERTQTDLYIGNQYDGTSIENIYLNVMLTSV